MDRQERRERKERDWLCDREELAEDDHVGVVLLILMAIIVLVASLIAER